MDSFYASYHRCLGDGAKTVDENVAGDIDCRTYKEKQQFK